MKRVLIVDDEIDLCLLLKQFLIKRNYEVYIAHTLSAGLQLLDQLRPESLILDNNLPDGMGWEEAGRLHEQYPQMNITLVSAYQHAKDYKNKISDSIHFLEKPLSFMDVEKYI